MCVLCVMVVSNHIAVVILTIAPLAEQHMRAFFSAHGRTLITVIYQCYRSPGGIY